MHTLSLPCCPDSWLALVAESSSSEEALLPDEAEVSILMCLFCGEPSMMLHNSTAHPSNAVRSKFLMVSLSMTCKAT